MTKRYCAYVVDGSYRFKWQADIAGLIFKVKHGYAISLYNQGMVNLEIFISIKSLPFFRLSVPNKTYCYGLLTCIKMALSDLAAHEIDDTKDQYLREIKALRRSKRLKSEESGVQK